MILDHLKRVPNTIPRGLTLFAGLLQLQLLMNFVKDVIRKDCLSVNCRSYRAGSIVIIHDDWHDC
jgi:hypothetical protein